jgi:hypothetical protein
LIKQGEFNFIWRGEKTHAVVKRWFESFSASSEQYVKNKSTDEAKTLGAYEYIKKNLQFILDEKQRFTYLSKEFTDKIDKINNKCLIEDNAQRLVDVTIKFLFNRWFME